MFKWTYDLKSRRRKGKLVVLCEMLASFICLKERRRNSGDTAVVRGLFQMGLIKQREWWFGQVYC